MSPEAERAWAMVAAVVTAAAVAAAAYPFAAALVAPRDDRRLQPGERRYRRQLRQRSSAYRWFEPLVTEISVSAAKLTLIPQLQKDLNLTEPEAGWRAADYFAIRRLESLAVFIGGFAVGLIGFDTLSGGIVIGLLLAGAYPYFIVQRVASRARAYRDRVEARLPLMSDLIALILEGSNLPEALRVAARENRGHPLGDELTRALAAYDRHPVLQVALREMADRVGSVDLSEFVFMVVTALDRGTEVREALQSTAERLRVRRIQRLERAAEVAKVKIAGPALIVMIACLIIILAPFLLIGYMQGR